MEQRASVSVGTSDRRGFVMSLVDDVTCWWIASRVEVFVVQVKVLYVRNLKSDVTEEQLRDKFEEHGKVERVKKVKDYGFVHFEDRDNALRAMELLNGTVGVCVFSLLFCSLAVLDPRVGHTMDVLPPFILSILCHSD